MRKRNVYNRLKAALEKDASIVTDYDKIKQATGIAPEYLYSLGLLKGDLKFLEAIGVAVRGYVNPGRKGYRVRWVLLNTSKLKERTANG